jgi:hypothetical protein
MPSTPEISDHFPIPTIWCDENPTYTVIFADQSRGADDYSSDEEEPYDEAETTPEQRKQKFQQMIESHKTTIADRIGAKNFQELYSVFHSNSLVSAMQKDVDLNDYEASQLDDFVKARVSSECSDVSYRQVMHDLYKILHLELNQPWQ